MLLWGLGVGLGIVIDGQIFRGEYGGAGELGHLVISYEGTPCYCGQRGGTSRCTPPTTFVLGEAKRHIAAGHPGRKMGDPSSLTIAQVYRAARSDATALRASFSNKRGQNRGSASRTLVNIFNPGFDRPGVVKGGIAGGEAPPAGASLTLSSTRTSSPKKQPPVQLKICELGEVCG